MKRKEKRKRRLEKLGRLRQPAHTSEDHSGHGSVGKRNARLRPREGEKVREKRTL